MKYSHAAAALKKRSAVLRSHILDMMPPGKAGHLGGSCSIADVTAVLYFHHMNINEKDPKDPKRDRLVFSKGHAVLAQYAALVEIGYIDRKEISKIKSLGGVLQGHPDMKTPGIEAVTGSLGQGLSVSVGMALGLRMDGSRARVFTICGDGELAEGQIWEAAMTASVYKTDNITAVVDWNGIQSTGRLSEVFSIDRIAEKWESFGWHVIDIDGHDIPSIIDALEEADRITGKPAVILARTVKGKGFPFAEDSAAFHNAALDEQQFKAGREAVEQMMKEAKDEV